MSWYEEQVATAVQLIYGLLELTVSIQPFGTVGLLQAFLLSMMKQGTLFFSARFASALNFIYCIQFRLGLE